jgi:hypothetical protein
MVTVVPEPGTVIMCLLVISICRLLLVLASVLIRRKITQSTQCALSTVTNFIEFWPYLGFHVRTG